MERLIALEGGLNFRDLGGYETDDGRRVRWRCLFRSGRMSRLTLSDQSRIRSLGIRVLCDLRSRDEREKEAVRWPAEDVVRLEWDYDPRQVDLRHATSAPGFSAAAARSAMLDFYRAMPDRFALQYAALFTQLAAGTTPLVFGCSAGKDRTGMAAALILTCLGVQKQHILADFALTDRVVDLERVLIGNPGASLGLGDGQSYLHELSAQTRAPLMRAAPEYLEAAFDQLRENYGSVQGYLRDRLQLTDEAVARIRAHILENVTDEAHT